MLLTDNMKALVDRLPGGPGRVTAYLTTPNLALGGKTPMELLRTEVGQQQVLSELQAHLDCGPP